MKFREDSASVCRAVFCFELDGHTDVLQLVLRKYANVTRIGPLTVLDIAWNLDVFACLHWLSLFMTS